MSSLMGAGQLAELAMQNGASNEVRWGAVALLGVLSIAEQTQAAPVRVATQAAVSAAKEMLRRVRDEADTAKDIGMRDFSQAMLTTSPKPPDDIAIELMGLPDQVAQQIAERAITSPNVPSTEVVDDADDYIEDGCVVGDVMTMSREELGLPPDAFKKMIWLEPDDAKEYRVRPVLNRGRVIAYAVDLVSAHKNLLKIAERVERQPVVAERTRARLAGTIFRYAQGKIAPSVRWGGGTAAKDVAILYSKNIGSNGGLTRSFFTPLGNHPDGLPMVGVVAVTSKRDEPDVLNTLSGNRGLVRPGTMR